MKMDPVEAFKKEVQERVSNYATDSDLQEAAFRWLEISMLKKYAYNFQWLGRPIIQLPQDIMAMQEVIWKVKPDVIIETGIAHGGSLIFYASMLQLIGSNESKVIGIDIDIRKHNKKEIENHHLFKKIVMIEGSSVDELVVEKVSRLISGKKKVMVVLDSNHTHDHVLHELKLYAPFVTVGSYLVVMDTLVEYLSDQFSNDRPWGKGDNPMTAVKTFLRSNSNFSPDFLMDQKLVVSACKSGYLKRVSKE